ncbi:LysR family transcriptional regulator [Nitrospirillum amazonense]|uniref:DNA-binding transcriptional LysR family regulator n=1 Tax=Nitrospirillum amazonense TaxID=28077 RepID=A0A560JJ72_9PROT|nr:LysR family transcriptional regulator [Nitrospirillum amazonense]MDG3442546.1 LysR family transcriptional regulator [Nitrospirillum amazonense]TWB68380.1 DNA-binding transcriptional LysR family regulator [Nitrospirillum amazonense]
MPHLPDFEAWAVFAKVVERGSFSAAAEDLGLSKTTVSKIITRLEERMRTTLLHRTTRQLSLTESGRSALTRASRILSDGAAIEEDISEEAATPRGTVKIAVTITFGLEHLAPVIPDFIAKYPEVGVDLHLTDDAIDMVAEGYDLAVRVGAAADSSLLISRLFSFRLPVVASPAYFERRGRPAHPRDLEGHEALLFSHVPDHAHWRFQHPEHGSLVVPVTGRFHVNNGLAAVPALVAGMGITVLPESFVWRELEDGRLEEVLADWTVPSIPVNMLTPPRRVRPARVRVMIEFLRQRFMTMPWARGVEM